MENNKKTLILSIVGILVLVIAVVGVSFAMYSFTGTGTKENVITTGTVSMSFDPDNNMTLTNQYPMSDAKGVEQETNKVEFGVTADFTNDAMQINYDLGITNITAGDTLTSEYIKVALLDGEGTVLVGTQGTGATDLTAGVTIASLQAKAGTNGLIDEYALTSGTITTSGQTDNYTLIAYVSDQYDLPTDAAQAGSGTTQTKATKSETYSFKVGVSAAQA